CRHTLIPPLPEASRCACAPGSPPGVLSRSRGISGYLRPRRRASARWRLLSLASRWPPSSLGCARCPECVVVRTLTANLRGGVRYAGEHRPVPPIHSFPRRRVAEAFRVVLEPDGPHRSEELHQEPRH